MLDNQTEKEIKYEILPEDFNLIDLDFKIILIGDSGVGKSCLTLKGTKNIFEDYYQTTIGFEFSTFNIKINDKYIRLSIWDTCGQEIYRSIISGFYRNSSLAMIVYSIDNFESFQNIHSWIKDLKQQSNPDIKIFLIGNKSDLSEKRVVEKEKGENFSKENNFHLFFETSAKTGFNAKNIFIEAAKILYFEHLNYIQKASLNQNNNNNITQTHEKNNVNHKNVNKSNIPIPKKLHNIIIEDDERQKKGCC